MFSKNEEIEVDSSPADTLVSRTTEIVGDIHFSGELIVEGRIKGSVYAEDDSSAIIRIAESGSVEGEICVPSSIINGIVQGDVRSTKHIELAKKAVVAGNVYYNLIEMVMGSEVNGNLMHISSNQKSNKLLPEVKEKLPFDSDTSKKD
jgi:cytoskeletal protein CcmA (bactofilin family)